MPVPVVPGIIPARAGFTPCAQPSTSKPRDHPRSRGVYPTRTRRRRSPPGSSPLARGLRSLLRAAPFVVGIIPARAGFTSMRPRAGRIAADHPRSRGVYTDLTAALESAAGSSPLARGLRKRRLTCRFGARIIPARAGFTVVFLCFGWSERDHPRSRGVYITFTAKLKPNHGSSPLARGLHQAGPQPTCSRGIIPARAGFTVGTGTSRPQRGDHPRSRGVYEIIFSLSSRVLGSSPLARGLLLIYLSQFNRIGIIPARAGFTFWTIR